MIIIAGTTETTGMMYVAELVPSGDKRVPTYKERHSISLASLIHNMTQSLTFQ